MGTLEGHCQSSGKRNAGGPFGRGGEANNWTELKGSGKDAP